MPGVKAITTTSSTATLRRYERSALLIAAVIYSCTLTYPFNNDNALYAYMADLLIHGRLPYLGSWDQNFPGIIGVHVVPLLLGLRSQFAFHVWDIALQLCAGLLSFRILVHFYNERAALIGVVLSALYYVQQGLWMAGERDTYVTLLLLALFYLVTSGRSAREKASVRSLAFAGALTGVIILFRPTYGLYGVFLIGWVLFTQRGQPKPGSIHARSINATSMKRALIVAAACTAPVVLIVAVYAVAGGLHELWASVIQFNFRVYGGHGEQFPFWEPIRFYAISLAPALVGMWVWWKHDKESLTLWLLFFVASVISLIVLYRHSVYHYHPAMVLFLLLSSGGWERMIGWVAPKITSRGRLKRSIELSLTGVVILFFGFQTLRGNTLQQVIRDLAGGRIHSLKALYGYYEGSPEFGVPIQMEVGEYLRMHTHPGEAVQMFGPYSFPQYDARLGTASRFQTAHAILMRGNGDTLQPFQRVWRAEYLADLNRVKPIYFIVCDGPEAFRQYYGGLLGHEVLTNDFTELGAWVKEHYTPETKIGAFTLYKRLY